MLKWRIGDSKMSWGSHVGHHLSGHYMKDLECPDSVIGYDWVWTLESAETQIYKNNQILDKPAWFGFHDKL